MSGGLRFTCAAALLAIVAVFGSVTAASSRDADGPTISIKAPASVLAPGKTATLRIEVGDVDVPYTIDVYENPWPYKRERRIESFDVTDSDRRTLKVRPDFNTRYRAIARGYEVSTSKYPAVWVDAKGGGTRIETLNRRRSRIRAQMVYNVSPKLPYKFAGRKVVFYMNELGTHKLVPMGKGRTREPSPGKVRARDVFKIPSDHRYRYYITWCFDTERKDIGVGKPQPKKCPRHTVSESFFKRSAAAGRSQP